MYLKSEISTLGIYKNSISTLTSLYDNLLGDSGIGSLLNCKFIGRNVKILLKYLNKSLGTNIYNVGVCLLTAGAGMSLSISFTILLNIIFNIKKEDTPNPKLFNYS